MRATRLYRAILVVALIAAAMVIGALLLDRPAEPSSVAVGYVPLPRATMVPRYPREYVLPGGVSDTSALVMVQGSVLRRLTVWSISGNTPPVEVDRGIHPYPLLPNPARTRVLYSAGRALMVLDVAARRAQIVGEVPDGGSVIAAQWSPSGRMIAYVVQLEDERVSYLAWQDGSQPARKMFSTPRSLPIDVAWLADGRPVTIFLGVGPVGGLEARMWVYDWLSDLRSPLPPGVKPLQPHAPWRSPDGSVQLYPLSGAPDRRVIGGCPTSGVGVAGPEWLSVVEAGGTLPEVAFEKARLLLDRPTWLQDGRVLVRGMASAACNGGSGLYVGVPGGTLNRLISARSTLDAFDLGGALDGFPYAVSPDEQFAIWADTDLEAARSTIYRTHLRDGASEALYQTPDRYVEAPTVFKDREMIVGMVWLP